MSLRFRSTAWPASLSCVSERMRDWNEQGRGYRVGSIMGAKSAMRALSLLVVGWRSQPSAAGLAVGSLVRGCVTTPNRDFHDLPCVGSSLSRQQRTLRAVDCDGYRAWR